MTSPETSQRLIAWFREWRHPLRKFLIGKGSVRAADLDDVAQEVFLRLLRYERAELIEHPQAYLYKMAANVAAEWAIRARVTHPHESKWLADLKSDGQPEDDVARSRLGDEVERALNTLSPRQREVLKLQFSEGLGYAEIAVRLGTTHRAVKRMVVKSYERLRQELDADLLGIFEGVAGHGRE